MARRLTSTVLVVVALVFTPLSAIHASTDDLLEALAYVPETALQDGGLISYLDHRAVEEAQPGAAQPASYAEWDQLFDADAPAYELWRAAFSGVNGGMSELLVTFTIGADEWPALLGFDFFDVDRQLGYGRLPDAGLVLAGTLDPAAIVAAFEARGFVAEAAGDRTMLCSEAGCDSGLEMDLSAMDRANPFGGSLGRKQPLLVSPEVMLSSASLVTIEAMQDANDGVVPSLAEKASLRLLVDLIPGDAFLRQAMIAGPEALTGGLAEVLMSRAGVEDLQAALGETELEPIPPYELASFVDTATPDAQVTYVALTFADAADAEIAADVMPRRIGSLGSLVVDRTIGEILERRGVTSIETDVHTAPDGSGAVMLMTLRSAPPLIDPDDIDRSDATPSLVYRALFDMIFRRDVLWLAPDLPSDA